MLLHVGANGSELELLPIEEIAGDWETVMTVHFGSGGKLDQLQRR